MGKLLNLIFERHLCTGAHYIKIEEVKILHTFASSLSFSKIGYILIQFLNIRQFNYTLLMKASKREEVILSPCQIN